MFASKNRPKLAPWEQFCKDEARRAAHEFLEKVRRQQTVDDSSMEIPENVFASKFSAYFMDEVMDLTGSPNETGDFSSRNKKPSTGKSWWNIFKRKQARDDKGSPASSAANKNDTLTHVAPTGTTTILEAHVKMLDMDRSSHALSWQACRLLLTSEQGNHQLEIYCPPKSTFPKMTLFCFLLKEVRSSTALELPDSMTSFVVKSDKNGEYVFDAGSEKEKENWISTIRSFSSRICHQYPAVNGHIANKPRSHSISGAEHSRLRRPHYEQHHALVSFPVVPSAGEGGAQPANTGRDRPTLKSLSASPSPCHSSNLVHQNRNSSNCSTPCDIGTPERDTNPSFFRCRPQQTSPNPRQRRTLSMYEHGSLPRPSYPSQTQSQTPPSPPPSPSPPLPKRSQRSLSSLNEIKSPTETRDGAFKSWKNGSNPAIITSASSPNGVDNCFSSNPGNLDTCSQNSSSSALHPVTLAASTQQRTRNGRHSSVSSINTSPTTVPKHLGKSQLSPGQLRKLSTATSTSPSDSTNWTQEIEDEICKAKQRFPSCDGLSDVDLPGPNGFSNRSTSPSDGRRIKHDGSPSPPMAHGGMHSPAASPSVLHRFSPTLNPYIEEKDELHRDSAVIEVFPSREHDTGRATCMSPSPNQPHSKPRSMRFFSDTQMDGVQHNVHHHHVHVRTPSPSSGGATSTHESHQTEEHNGVFIEFHHRQHFPPGLPSQTTHPYASWAITHQDAQNLRDLVQFPWFHGMISRANATQLVLREGEAGSGKYLVRQSESREGEFVLTFNYRGRAKHLRIVLDSTGCSVQHLFFTTVSNMLDYFKQNTIPLETCWSEDDCRITEFIHRSASDSLRTITAIYNNDLLSSPRMPRRSHSLQIALTQAVVSAMQQNTAAGGQGASGRSRRGSSSLPQTSQPSTSGWRQIFRSNRASTLQRRHSEVSNMHHAIDNNYTTRF